MADCYWSCIYHILINIEIEKLLLMALSTKKGIAKFNPGIGWGNVSDTG